MWSTRVSSKTMFVQNNYFRSCKIDVDLGISNIIFYKQFSRNNKICDTYLLFQKVKLFFKSVVSY